MSCGERFAGHPPTIFENQAAFLQLLADRLSADILDHAPFDQFYAQALQ